MVTQAPRRLLNAVAAAFILASIGLTLFVWHSVGGTLPLSARGYRVHVSFANASTLAPNADVRIAGVKVGKVVAVRPDGLRTDATVELDHDHAPLAADARAILRLKSLLGETFVALTPGSRTARPVPDGGRLAVSRVASTQPLDRVLGMLDASARRDVDALLSSGATALRGRSADLDDALGNLDPVSAQLESISRILDGQHASVAALVRDGGTVLQTVGERRAALQGLVTAGDRLTAATARRAAGLTATTRALPGLLRQLDRTAGVVLHTAQLARPTLRQVRAVAPLVAPGLASLRRLAPQVRAVLAQLRVTLPTARRALPATAHFVDSLVPFVETLYPAAREIVPTIALVRAYRQEINATVANVAAATQATAPGADGRPVHYLRALIPFTEEAIVGYPKRLASNRHNAYHAPGELDQLGRGGLHASDCRNTAGAQVLPVIGSGAPPCRVQPPWSFQGATRYFPHVDRTAP